MPTYIEYVGSLMVAYWVIGFAFALGAGDCIAPGD